MLRTSGLNALALSFLVGSLSGVVRAGEGNLPESIVSQWEEARADDSLPYDVKTWITGVVRKNYEDSAHQWAVIQPQIPAKYQQYAQATWLFMLYKLDLPQTFADAYLKALLDAKFVKSQALKDLEAGYGDRFSSLMAQHVTIFTPEQQTLVPKLPAQGLGLDLQAWAYLRKGDKAKVVLDKLPADHKMRDYLERTVALSLVKKGKIEKALELFEGIAKRTNKVEGQEEIFAGAKLQQGRLLYQMADLKAAEAAYEAVPEKSQAYLSAREELMWIWLRTGGTAKLRGTIQSFASNSLDNRLMPEFYVVRAISNLKLCFFDAAKRDFEGFVAYNSGWSEKIDIALKSNEPATPPELDWYTAFIVKAQDQLQDEIKILDELKKKSITASLPSVGEQKHWKEASESLTQRVQLLDKLKLTEYRRQWRNNSVAMRESIRKMQFVKLELLSQLETGKAAQIDSETALENHDKIKTDVKEEASGRLSFRFDGVTWSDELFKLRSTAPNVCL